MATKLTELECLDEVDCSDGCPTAAVMFGVPRVRVLATQSDGVGLRLTVETERQVEGCRGCGVRVVPHGRREHLLHDDVRAPAGPDGLAQAGVALPRTGVRHDDVQRGARVGAAAGAADPPGSELGSRRTDRRQHDGVPVGPAARRRLAHAVHTLKVEARRRADDPARLCGVESLGVDEHIWRPGKSGTGREVTGMVDLTRDASGQVRARLLDLVLVRACLRRLA